MLQGIGGGEHGLFGVRCITAVNHDIAGQPEQLAEKRHPLKALFTDANGTRRHHAADHEQIVVGLVVGDDHAGALVFQQALDLRTHFQPQDQQGRHRVKPRTDAAVIRVERATDTQNQSEETGNNEQYPHQEHAQSE